MKTLKRVVVKGTDGLTFLAKGDSSHWVVMDGAEEVGGSDAGSRPKELLLMALGGCTAFDVVSILRKKRVLFSSFEVFVSGNTREEHPQVFTDIHVEYVVKGKDIDAHDVERAIELSTTKYCSVSAMLRQSVPITHSYRIESPELRDAVLQD
jgi:putative redox protein